MIAPEPMTMNISSLIQIKNAWGSSTSKIGINKTYLQALDKCYIQQ